MKQKENTPPTRLSGTKGKYTGFTLIELLVSISILATISIVAYVSISGHMKIANNATRIAAIDSLHLSLRDYYQMKKILPEPNSNYISYDERGTYMHSLSGAYGVSGHVTYDFLPAGYVNFEATDPESHQFYGYGKTLGSKTESDNDENDAKFDVAAVLYDEKTGGYKTYIRGTYEKQRLSSLIRAYSSSNFVSQDSTEDLPYNPYERKVTAYISSYSGTLTLTNGKNIPLLSMTWELNSGDIVTLWTGSTALLHISDGSELSLGSNQSQTILALSTLEYNDDNNLASKVALWLKSGEVWTEAPHLRTEADSVSDFSIRTDSALAAVRGTVFGVTRDASGTTFALSSGKLEVEKISDGTPAPFTTDNFFSTTATGGFILQDAKSYMVVPDGGQPITLTVPPPTESNTPTSTGTLAPDAVKRKIQHPYFSLGYRPRPDSVSFTGQTSSTGILSVTFQNYWADEYYLSFGTGDIDNNAPFPILDPNPFYTGSLSNNGPITITGAFSYTPGAPTDRTFALRVRSHGVYSAPFIIGLSDDIQTYDYFHVWGEKKNSVHITPLPCFTMQIFCDEPNLVAYAPYNVAGDLKMYTGSMGYMAGESAQILNNTTPLPLDINEVQSYGTGSSFVQMNSGTKGIFIDNDGGGEYLKYSLPTNFLTGSFSIEMSVRGAALKRTSGTYYLLNNTNSSTKPYLNMYNGTLQFWYYSSWFNQIVTISSGTLSDLSSNVFYSVRATFNGSVNPSQWKIEIKNAPTPIIATWFVTSTILWGAWLEIGSVGQYSQWNDIIDSVKIYKN